MSENCRSQTRRWSAGGRPQLPGREASCRPRRLGRPTPQISEFYGIVVRMYYDEAPHRGRPHSHADYAGRAATVEIATGRVLAGRLPPAQRRLVRRWAAAHRDELEANWRRARDEQPLESIAPLA